MNNPQVIVVLNNISKISDGKRILTQLDLETYDGESLTLQSPSSGGKSTLQRPDVAAKVAEAIDYPSPVKDATPLLTPAFRNNPMVFPERRDQTPDGADLCAPLGIKIRQQGWEVVPAGTHDYRGSKPKTSTQCTSQDRTR